jgi:transposase
VAGTYTVAVDTRARADSRCPGCQERDAIIENLREHLRLTSQKLRQAKQQLQEQGERCNSSNSSVPPSSNPPDAPRPQSHRPRSGRKRGAQPDHPPTNRGLFPAAELSEAPIPSVPTVCEHCQAPLTGSDPRPQRHQVIELPPIRPEIREYQRHLLTCSRCGQNTLGPLPEGVPSNTFGPRLQAFVGLCTGCYHLSKRQVEELLDTAYDIPISLGSICNIEQVVSAAIAEPVAEVKEHIQQADVAHADETSFPQQPSKGWLWAAVTSCLAIFCLRRNRDRASAEHLLGANFGGILVSDRYSSYDWVKRRQLCWAHLRRDWQRFIDRGGRSGRLGRRLMRLTNQMFHLWHRVRDGTLSRPMFRYHMIAIREAVGATLRTGANCSHSKTAGTCAEILQYEDALWTFVRVEGVEPTNNAAERIVRQAVLWRKKSFGTRSAAGSEFVERILSVVATCRLQERNVLEYLTAACTAAIARQPSPSLLPTKR